MSKISELKALLETKKGYDSAFAPSNNYLSLKNTINNMVDRRSSTLCSSVVCTGHSMSKMPNSPISDSALTQSASLLKSLSCECNSRVTITTEDCPSRTTCECNSRTTVSCVSRTSCGCNSRCDSECSCEVRVGCSCRNRGGGTVTPACACNAVSDSVCGARTTCMCDIRCSCNSQTVFG